MLMGAHYSTSGLPPHIPGMNPVTAASRQAGPSAKDLR
jgi:hypothetical protein